MEDILKADIFFFIASLGVVLFTILVGMALYQVVRILKLIRRIVERVDAGSEVLVDDIENLRESFSPARIISFIMSFIPMQAPRKRRRNDQE